MTHLFLTHKANPASFILTAGAIMLLALVAFSNVTRADVKTFIVNTDADPTDPNLTPQHCTSLCTLRVAIADANDHHNDPSQPDIITFNIPGAGVHTIVLALCLPTITDPVIIDGWSQDGFTNTTPNIPLIALDGSQASGGCGETSGLNITAGGSTVKGLIIGRFPDYGIHLSTKGGNTIIGNYIGTNSNGTGFQSNRKGGIFIDDVPDNTIGGTDHSGVCDKSCNVISGNGFGDGGVKGYGILIQGSSANGNVVQGNFIGVRVGTQNSQNTLSNGSDGILIEGAPNTTIGGADHDAGVCNHSCNVISGNSSNGIEIDGLTAKGTQIQGNFIGVGLSGTFALGNIASGVLIDQNTPGALIGGGDHDVGVCNRACNLISGNGTNGVNILAGPGPINISPPLERTTVTGNFIGTDKDGNCTLDAQRNCPLGNHNDGISIFDTPSNEIGGQTAQARNVISGNSSVGIRITDANATGNVVEGNFIGTNAAGNGVVPNGEGIFILFKSSFNRIGGTAAGSKNIISGNFIGIEIRDSTKNSVQGNWIGTNANGNLFLGNDEEGIQIGSEAGGSINNTIGGIESGAGNTIAYNGGPGVSVSVFNSSSTGNAILGNTIFSNKKLGIDLGRDGVTQNDTLDPDTGPNNLQNFPVLTSAIADDKGVTISGTINTLANTTLRIEFFSNAACGPSTPTGYGQGALFIGFKEVTADDKGNADFTVVAQGSFSSSNVLTATATTDPGNDTSEFSQCIPIKSTTGCQGTIAPPNSRSASPAAPALLGSSTALPPPRTIQAACTPDTSLLQTDDGSFEQPIGFPNGASTAYFVNRIAPPISARYPFKLQKLEIFFGNRSNGLAVNTPITLVVGTNDSGGSNINGTTFSRFATTVGFLNQLNVYDLSQIADPNLVLASGDFVVGFEVNDPPNVFPADEDTSSSSQGRSYISTDGTNFTLIDSFTGLAGNFGIRAEILPVFAEGEICDKLTVSVKPSGSPKPVVFKPTAKKVAKQSFSVTVTNKTGIAQTVSNLDALLGEPFTIVSISPATPRTIKNGKKQTFTVKTQRAAGLGTATATAPFFFTQTSCGLLIPAGRLAQAVPFDSQGVRLELQEGQLRLQVGGTGMESVRLELFDLSGRKLLDRADANGLLSLPIAMDDGAPLANGVYLYVITGRSQQGEMMPSQVRKLVIRR
ncbi:hypothetical protein HY230_05820 [Candidatus Acetothermia bacterium]|nr:hypothetical protein [Candidatus Acetothermia bacterium]